MVPYMEALAIERDALVQLMAMVFCTSALALALTLAETGRYDEDLRNLSSGPWYPRSSACWQESGCAPA